MVIFGSNCWDTDKLHPQCVCLEPNSILCKSSKNSPLLNHLSSHPHDTLLKCTLPSTHTLLSYFIHEGTYEVCIYNVPECVHTHFTVHVGVRWWIFWVSVCFYLRFESEFLCFESELLHWLSLVIWLRLPLSPAALTPSLPQYWNYRCALLHSALCMSRRKNSGGQACMDSSFTCWTVSLDAMAST